MTTDNITIIVDELPRNCYECPFCVNGTIYTPEDGMQEEYWYACFLTRKEGTTSKRRKDCPLRMKTDGGAE